MNEPTFRWTKLQNTTSLRTRPGRWPEGSKLALEQLREGWVADPFPSPRSRSCVGNIFASNATHTFTVYVDWERDTPRECRVQLALEQQFGQEGLVGDVVARHTVFDAVQSGMQEPNGRDLDAQMWWGQGLVPVRSGEMTIETPVIRALMVALFDNHCRQQGVF